MLRLQLLAVSLLVLATSAHAARPAPPMPRPEIQRQTAAAQPVGAAHTLRIIPEACVRLEGRFTGLPAAPYKFVAVRTSARCQHRARMVDAASAKASTTSGWVLNDEIRVPSAVCATQQAVIRIWRKDAAKAVPPKLDAQGRSRIYLKGGLDAARQGDLGAIPVYAAAMSMQGTACK